MAIIYPKEGKSRELELIKSGGSPTHKIGLFQSNTTPDIDTTWAGITEASYGGYIAASATFGSITINGDDNAEMTSTTVIYTAPLAGSQDIYGWVWYSDLSGTKKIHRIERFAGAPIVFTSGADPIIIRIRPQQGECP